MDQNNNNSNQPWNQQPLNKKTPVPASEPKSKTGRVIIWSIVAIVGVSLIGLAIYKIALLGKKVGKEVGGIIEQQFREMDSLSRVTNDDEYATYYQMLGTDSLSMKLHAKADGLKSSTDSMCALLDNYYNGFLDTLGDASGFSSFDSRYAENYFLKTGRATSLKEKLRNYRASEFNALPVDQRDSSIYYYLPIVDAGQNSNALVKNILSWEAIHFRQAPTNVKLSLRTLKRDVRKYEKHLLLQWESIAQSEVHK